VARTTPPRARSLRLELVATLAIVLMMAVVSLALAGEWLGRRRHAAQEEERLRQHAEALAAIVAAAPAEVERALRPSLGSQGIVAIEIYRIDGERTAPTLQLGIAPDLALPRSQRAVEGGTTLGGDDAYVVVDRSIRTFGTAAPELVLRVVASRSAWTSLDNWREIALLAGGVGGILFVMGVLLLEAQVLRPLLRVRTAVEAVAEGDLRARVPDEGPAELQALAAAFNRMAESLAAHEREIGEQRERLVRAEQLASLGRIAAGTAHEVGNPLASVLGYVDLLLDRRGDPPLLPEQRELIERAREQLLRIQGILAQLIDLGRPTRRAYATVDLRESTLRLFALVRHDPRCEGVTLRVRGDAKAHGDASAIDQVLLNLVVNACRAAKGEGGEPIVEVALGSDDDVAWIEVQDTGSGVSDEIRPRLFEPFFTTARAGEGTGLGLAVSLGVVESMDGTLACLPAQARPPLAEGSSGAVFRVTLPASGRGAISAAEPANPAGATPV
jgi:signal transduction histidine kinase